MSFITSGTLTAVFALSIVKVANVRCTRFEGAVFLSKSVGEFLRNDLVKSQGGRGPTTAVNSTVEPFLASIGSGSGSELR